MSEPFASSLYLLRNNLVVLSPFHPRITIENGKLLLNKCFASASRSEAEASQEQNERIYALLLEVPE